MPALSNPRHERFAQALFAGLTGETHVKRAQSTAYLTAYPNCSNGNSAEAAASRLLRRVKPIADRVRELQAEANARLQPKLDLSRERVGRNLDYASTLAKQQKSPANIVAAETAIAKIFHRTDVAQDNPQDFKSAKSMTDIGRKLLQSMGLKEPDDASIQAAIEANDAFVDRLKAISEAAQGAYARQDD
jgi:hypothetical protein